MVPAAVFVAFATGCRHAVGTAGQHGDRQRAPTRLVSSWTTTIAVLALPAPRDPTTVGISRAALADHPRGQLDKGQARQPGPSPVRTHRRASGRSSPRARDRRRRVGAAFSSSVSEISITFSMPACEMPGRRRRGDDPVLASGRRRGPDARGPGGSPRPSHVAAAGGERAAGLEEGDDSAPPFRVRSLLWGPVAGAARDRPPPTSVPSAHIVSPWPPRPTARTSGAEPFARRR